MKINTAALRTLLLGLALAANGAIGANTNVAQVPLLNITGTGTVKPNLMVLYDNSGSMRQTYTPDYIDDTICRSGAALSVGRRSCAPGDPPFMAGEFNRQYYNPKITYVPPVNADGTSYASMTAGNTSNWTAVQNDGFGVNTTGLDMSTTGTMNLTNGFPDLRWCNGSDCRRNTSTYTYPDNTYRTAENVTSNPYYYTILAAEYCTDRSLTNCVSTTPGAAAPAGYPVPAKVRWCNSTSLTTCQAKYLAGSYVYPRFSSPTASAAASYGVISIGLTSSTRRATIRSVSVAEAGGPVVITNGPVVSTNGVDTATKQAALANALAASITAKTGLTREYTACVKTPSSSAVQNCANWGINLSDNNLVAVIPIECPTGATGKGLGQCSIVSDNSRNGWGITALTDAPATALIRITGTSSNNKRANLQGGTRLGGTTLLTNDGDFAPSTGAAAMASAIASRIGTSGAIQAYAGANAVTSICAAQSAGTICLIDNSGASGLAVTMGNLTNNTGTGGSASQGSIVFNTVASSQAGEQLLPITTTPLSAGGAVFVRVDIKPAQNAYPRDPGRSDCTTNATSCTYAEEMTNFANWYVYYKTRNQMMKVALGRAFQPLNGNFRVGMVSLSRAAAGSSFEQLPSDFTGTNRSTWYQKLYAMNGNSTTPMRGALHAVGLMYKNTSGVVQFPCQQNFTFVTTDGYWNGDAAATVTDNDKIHDPSRFCTSIKGCPDPRNTSPQSLADIALYWYNGGSNTGTSTLNPAIDDMTKPGQVPGASDDNTHLHMRTYTLGLGMIGVMDFDKNYDTSPEVGGDFYRLITGASGCPWNAGGRYVWPDPKANDGASTVQERVDDLWHAAINGRGKYFSAADPEEVVDGLNAALNNIQARTGAAAAAATSTPNLSQEDNNIFSSTFTTVKWNGELTKKKLDINTGAVMQTPVWSTNDTLGAQIVAAGTGQDGRTIKMWGNGADNLKNFSYDAMDAQEKSWFSSKCMSLAQCSSLSPADRAIVNNGTNLVNWLRGQQQYADNTIFRAYAQTETTPSVPIVLGDIASAKPAYVRDPRKSYTLPGYEAFREANKNRVATVYVAANDGMLHAFRADGVGQGQELWAYAPRITMKKLYLQSSTTYGTNHQYTVDGSPEVADIQIGGVWKTVLVAGLNAGGRGYYALDITDPLHPKALWEICADSSVCAINDPDIGLTFGNPQIGFWNGKWVVFLTSGYNNVPGVDGVGTGSGGGYLYIYEIATGAQLAKIATGSGDTGTPSGFARITAVSTNPDTDPKVVAVYGGDNLGQMWRFTMPTGATINKTLVTTTDGGRPITTRPEIVGCRVDVRAHGEVSDEIDHQMVLFGTGRLLDLPDITDTSLQTVYAIEASDQTVTAKGSSMARQTLERIGTSGDSRLNEGVDNPNINYKGWYMDLALNPGERVNLDPKVIRGTAVVITNIPAASSSCSVGGTSNMYQLNVCTGRAASGDGVVGRVLSNTSAVVGAIIIQTPNGGLKLLQSQANGVPPPGDPQSIDPSVTEDPRMGGWRRIYN